MRTSYGRAVEVGRLCFHSTRTERIILDVPRQNPEYDSLWLAMSPNEAHRLAALLEKCASAAEQAQQSAAGRPAPAERWAA